MNKAESGLQLLSRLDDRPLLNDFDNVLFPNGGPYPKEVIEITGDTNTGKTILLTEIIAKAILPVNNGGRNVGVVLINTDFHFQIIKLVTALEKFAKVSQKNDMEEIIKESLKNLHILECHDEIEFSITIKRLGDILAERDDIAILALDSVATFYWSEQIGQNQTKMDTHYKMVLRNIQTSAWEYKIVLFYTRPAYFFTKNGGDNFNETPKPGCINYRVKLEREMKVGQPEIKTDESEEENMFLACIETSKSKDIHKYIINEHGFQWIC